MLEMLDDSSSPRSGSTWLDVFPWLPAIARSSDEEWNTPTERADEVTVGRLAGVIAELASERLTHWTIGQILPSLPPDVELSALDLPTRAANSLSRHGIFTTGELANEYLGSLMGWRGIGAGTINGVIARLVRVSTTASPSVLESGVPASAAASADTVRELPDDHWLRAVRNDIALIADWCALIGIDEKVLLDPSTLSTAPNEVRRAAERLLTLRLNDIPADARAKSLSVVLDDALALLEPRALEILKLRLLSEAPMTLEDLGRKFGVTRERVRQIEGKARGALLTAVSESAGLADVAESIASSTGTIRPLSDLIAAYPSLAETVPSADQPAWRVLDQLDDAYEIVDGWRVAPSMAAAEAATLAIITESADAYGVARISDLSVVTVGPDTDADSAAEEWLTRCGYIIDSGFVLRHTGSVGDYGAAVLSIVGTPMTAQAIVERFAFDRTAGSLRNAMSQDARFERVDRELWGLKEWGLGSYGGIRAVIREHLGVNGGEERLDALVERITGRYSVSASSVIAYANAAPFETVDGTVRTMRAGRTAEKPPERTRRLFRRADGWAYRITVSSDHLRGSGFVAPKAMAHVLGLGVGDSIQLDSRLGPQVIAWTGIQPSFGSIRRFLLDADIEANTDAFLTISDDRVFDFAPADALIGEPAHDLLALTGAPADTENAWQHLVHAANQDPSTPFASVVDVFRGRGDDDIADLLISLRDELDPGTKGPSSLAKAPDVSYIMDLL
ncbi:sigma factor-like helix-turn-helix DNA-binding protein [Microbacterium sp.]|uniref:sigma factor-like helix-turn-helix DNA-binding protein n=1 Tax=Microbacterium sp. TaxID=51671 RepID=UPI0028AF9A69|nr:sigma factor-like helix-turn-helix DNA-binding protein [Microbacterium sp.]